MKIVIVCGTSENAPCIEPSPRAPDSNAREGAAGRQDGAGGLNGSRYAAPGWMNLIVIIKTGEY